MRAMPDLCDRCRSLDLQAALEELQARQRSDPDPTQPASQPKIEWHTNIKQIGASYSSSHCALCALVLKGWRESRAVTIEKNLRSADIVNPDNPPADFAKDILDIECYDKDATVSVEVLSRRNEVDDGRGLRGHVFLKITCSAAYVKSWEANFPLEAEFHVFRDGIEGDYEDEGLASDVDVAINPNPLSIGSFEIISAWLSNCTSKHGQACGRGYITDWLGLPSRVLDVQPSAENPEMIRLRRRDSISTDDRRYVALSHRWGKTENPFCTTGDTINERMSGIRTSAMPCTFQDAVTVTRKLGLRYLWIDSLCIIQGDAADWAVEAADMSNIYQHCHLLIGAANSPSDNTGFLHSREQVDMVPLGKFQIQLLPPESSRWTDSSSIDPLLAEPLNERAWCLQERVLPTRRLFYGSAQMFWECQTLRASEGGDVVDHIGGINLRQLYRTGNSSVSVFLRYPAEEPESNGEEAEEEEEISANRWTDWYQIVEEYSTRQLTKDDDRLVALGGLARLVARSTNAKYLAGIWETGLIEGLMWSRKSRDQQLRQPSAFSAPSWSWASIVGPVRFLMYTWSDRAQWKARYSDFEPLAEYRDCHIAPKRMEDGFGRLDGGRLTLRAPLLAVTALRPRQEDPVDTSQWANMVPDRSPVTDKVLHLRHGGKTTMWIEGGFDKPADVDVPLSQVFVIFLARLPSVGSTDKVSGHYRFLEHRFGLIVQRTDSGEFRRIGFVDGFILRQRLFGLPTALGGNHEFKNVSYVCDSSPEDDDGGPENKRAPDRLKLGAEELILI